MHGRRRMPSLRDSRLSHATAPRFRFTVRYTAPTSLPAVSGAANPNSAVDDCVEVSVPRLIRSAAFSPIMMIAAFGFALTMDGRVRICSVVVHKELGILISTNQH